MTALDHVGLSVQDLDPQADWYARALGLEVLHRTGSHAGLRAGTAPEAVLTQGYEGHLIEMLDRPGPPGTLGAEV